MLVSFNPFKGASVGREQHSKSSTPEECGNPAGSGNDFSGGFNFSRFRE
jgi:hypothetical protein